MRRWFSSPYVRAIFLLAAIVFLVYSQLRRTIALTDKGFQFTHHISWSAAKTEEYFDGIGDTSVRKATLWNGNGVIHIEIVDKNVAGTPREVVVSHLRSMCEGAEERNPDFWVSHEDEEYFTLDLGEAYAATVRFPIGNNQITDSKVAVISSAEFYIQVYLISSAELNRGSKREFWKVVNSLKPIEP